MDLHQAADVARSFLSVISTGTTAVFLQGTKCSNIFHTLTHTSLLLCSDVSFTIYITTFASCVHFNLFSFFPIHVFIHYGASS